MGAKVRITKRVVDQAGPKGDEENWIWDADVRGLFLRVYTTGRKSFALKYRVGRRQRILTLGPVGAPWTIELARRRAREILVAIANGVDPQVERVAARDALTIAEIIDLYLSEGPIDKPTKRTSTWVVDRSNLDCHVRPMIGRRVANEVTQRDCAELQRAIAMGKTKADVRTKPRGRAIVSGGPGTAARTMVTLAAMLNWAVKRGFMVSNPAKGVPRLKSDRVDRFLSQEEFARLFRALKDAERENAIAPSHAAIIRLLAFTGARKSEILGLRWEEIDLQRSAIVLASSRSKTGAKRIPLPAQAIDILTALPREMAYVFPPLKLCSADHTVGLQKAWDKDRARSGLSGVRLHDLRHSFASIAVAAGESLYVVQRALGHKNITTTQRYAHLRDDPLLELVGRVAGVIDKAGGEKD
jgi:integrase